jgi:Tat protein secretion system quality control protein TatD with DNase activity
VHISILTLTPTRRSQDPTFRGLNHKHKRVHEDDLHLVLARAKEHGVERIVVTGTSLATSRSASLAISHHH